MTISSFLRINFILFLSLLPCFTIAQEIDLAAYQNKYPGDLAVHKLKSAVITINLKNGQPEIKTHYRDEYVILDSKAINQFNTEEIIYNSFQKVSDVSAYILMPNKDKWKKINQTNITTRDKIADGSVFHDDDKVTTINFTGLSGPAVRVSEYDELSTDYKFPFGFFFKSGYPLEKGELIIDCDTSVHLLNLLLNNDDGFVKISESIQKGRKITTYTVENAPGLKFEERSPSFRVYTANYLGQVSHYTKDKKTVQVLENLDDLHTWYQNNLVEIEKETPSTELKNIADSITKNYTDEYEKVRAIYYWVQSNIKYVAFEEGSGGFVPRQSSEVCKKRYGDCKDMASLIYSMLKSQGITSYLTWVGTRDIPFQYSDFPSTATDNHMIATYKKQDGSLVFLDATSSYQPIEIPTYFIQGKEVLLHLAPNKYELAKVPILEAEQTTLMDTVYLSIQDSKLIGKAVVSTSGYYNTLIHDAYKNVKKDELNFLMMSYNARGNNTFKVENAKLLNLDSREKPLTAQFDFEIKNYISSYADEIYVNLNLEKELTIGEIPKDRIAPYELGFKSFDTRVQVLEIPEGYKVEFMPKNVNHITDFIEYKNLYELKGNKIYFTQIMKFKYLYLMPETFSEWNEFHKILKKSLSESIVLKKIK